MPLIDTHNHLYFSGFRENFSNILKQAQEAGVKQQILIGIDELSCQAALNLAQQYTDFKVSLGLHPCDVDQLGNYDPKHHQYLGIESTLKPQIKNLNQYFSFLEDLVKKNQNKVVAFGETGFDQYHRESKTLLDLQAHSFKAHLDLCLKHDKTLIIHSRGAKQATINFMKENQATFRQIRFVWHCFTEDEEALKTTLDLGGYIGVGGVSTYPKSNELRAALSQAPLENLLTETDAPFLPPQQARKKNPLNQPSFLPEVISTIADFKGQSYKTCENRLLENAKTAFKL